MESQQPHISVVSPVYGAATLLSELVARIHAALSQLTDSYEIILVEDGSPDNSWEIVTALAGADPRVTGIRLSRNFGQQYALNAGFDRARGEWIVSLDCDLQDEPERIVDLYREGEKGYDVVFASRSERQNSLLDRLTSRLFYRVMSYLSGSGFDWSVANFVLYRRQALEALRSMGDYYRYYPLMNNWIGFRTTRLPVRHAARKDGITSSYSFGKRLQLALITIVAYTDKPLRLVLTFGVSLFTGTFLVALYLAFRYVVTGREVSGWLSVFLSIWLLSGIIIVILGLIGIYIGKIFETVKKRPAYIVAEITRRK